MKRKVYGLESEERERERELGDLLETMRVRGMLEDESKHTHFSCALSHALTWKQEANHPNRRVYLCTVSLGKRVLASSPVFMSCLRRI